MKVEENRPAEGPMRGSRPDNRMKPRRDDSEFIAIEFDSTLGYPAQARQEFPILRPRSMESITWRKRRKMREMQKCEKKRHGDGEMQGVCMVKKCATCHNLEARGEFAPPPPEIRHPDHAENDNEMPDQNDTAEDDEMLYDGASMHILESLRELAKKNMPNTTTVIPRKRFARV